MNAIFIDYSDEEIWKTNEKSPLYLKEESNKSVRLHKKQREATLNFVT